MREEGIVVDDYLIASFNQVLRKLQSHQVEQYRSHIEQAFGILDKMPRTGSTRLLIEAAYSVGKDFNSALLEHIKQGQMDKALRLAESAAQSGHKPNRIHLLKLLLSQQERCKVQDLVRILGALTTGKDVVVANDQQEEQDEVERIVGTVKEYFDCRPGLDRAAGDKEYAKIYFKLIENLVDNDNEPEKALSMLRRVKAEGYKPNLMAYASLLPKLLRKNEWEKGFAVMKEMKEDEIEPDQRLLQSLLYQSIRHRENVLKLTHLLVRMQRLGFKVDKRFVYSEIAARLRKIGQPQKMDALSKRLRNEGFEEEELAILSSSKQQQQEQEHK